VQQGRANLFIITSSDINCNKSRQDIMCWSVSVFSSYSLFFLLLFRVLD